VRAILQNTVFDGLLLQKTVTILLQSIFSSFFKVSIDAMVFLTFFSILLQEPVLEEIGFFS